MINVQNQIISANTRKQEKNTLTHNTQKLVSFQILV